MANDKTRLSPEREIALKQALRGLNEQLSEIDKAEECGIDCKELRQARDEAAAIGEKILANFGSPQPHKA